MTDGGQPVPVRTIRLIFEYEDDRVSLVSAQPVNVVVTAFDVTEVQEPGAYVDVRDGAGKTLARVSAPNAFRKSAEIFPENLDDPIVRMDVAKPKGAFTVIVPVHPQANHVTVIRLKRADPEIRTATAIEAVDLATFPLQTKPSLERP